MPFWQLQTHADRPALIQGDTVTRYRQLADLADAWQNDVLPAHASFGLLQMPNHVQAIACYLACLRSGKHAPLLLSASTSAEQIAQLAAHYQPDWLLLTDDTPAPAGYNLHHHCEGLSFYRLPTATPKPQHPALALLLSTSGSTGSSKLVRLSASALDSNAQAILEYLGLHAEDRAITTLPLAYSFGMSILNSHLAVGGAVVLTDASMMDRNFWEAARTHSITSLSGVPATYEMLHRLGLHRLGLDKLRMLTQAGGRLRDDLIRAFAQTCRRMDIQFHVMYGQTEAAPRISHVPPERLADKIGSIGIAIPGGEMAIDPDNTELIYRGPNVMLGYAETRADLALGDCQQGELRTGDLARQDDDGYFYITGRLKRFLKISGNRINLDDVERLLANQLGQQVCCTGKDDALAVFTTEPVPPEQIRSLLQQHYRIFQGHVNSFTLEAMPKMASGKIDYHALQQHAATEPRP